MIVLLFLLPFDERSEELEHFNETFELKIKTEITIKFFLTKENDSDKLYIKILALYLNEC
ncbi:hypothetical protein bsdtb5_30230 [Anaeromicropila herbilytica]|uniref:Uncharacterized protein n=1 Tax=Anaeromicropila herbilytica TaxID=2785025 RepID=A0A7R7IDH4_9FIRM|nr:hypothetical protein bsdtb5_30230 [Anaeromicropila herbilytica]